MTDSLCIVCKENPEGEFKLVDNVIVCCIDCNYEDNV